IDKVVGPDNSLLNKLQCTADRAGGMMKTAHDDQARIVYSRCIQGNVRSGRTATEQIDESAFANQLHRGCPGLGLSHRLDDDVEERYTFVLQDAPEVGATRTLERFPR